MKNSKIDVHRKLLKTKLNDAALTQLRHSLSYSARCTIWIVLEDNQRNMKTYRLEIYFKRSLYFLTYKVSCWRLQLGLTWLDFCVFRDERNNELWFTKLQTSLSSQLRLYARWCWMLDSWRLRQGDNREVKKTTLRMHTIIIHRISSRLTHS